MVNLPELGVGIVYFPGLDSLIEAGKDLIDVIEIEPQTFWFKTRSPGSSYRLNINAFKHILNYPQHKIIHGVGFPIGGSTPANFDHLSLFLDSIKIVDAPWASEHLSFNRTRNENGEFNTGFLLPPLQTPAGVALAANNIRQLQSHLPVPFAFETGVNYLQPQSGEMSDGCFFAAVAEEADCGILLDLHNLWTNEKNGRQAVGDVLAEIPLDRVWEIHLAGGQMFQGYWLDAHSDLVPLPVMELAAEIIPYLPNLKALIFEIIDDYIWANHLKIEDLLPQIQQMRGLWDRRYCNMPNISFVSPKAHQQNCLQVNPSFTSDHLPSPAAWQEALGELVIGCPSARCLSRQLAQDSGVEILRQLVSTVRGGTVADVLKLTSRFLILSLGETNFREVLKSFWQSVPPEGFASDEVENFANYLRRQSLNIPYLNDVLEFELAMDRVLIEGVTYIVQFSCDPMPLLRALGKGRLPDAIIPGEFEVAIDPSTLSAFNSNL